MSDIIPNTASICGDFDEATNPDLGQAHPYRVKIDCEVPTLPVAKCGDDSFTVTYDPDATKRFSISAILYDENCDPVLDESGQPIVSTFV